MKITEEMLIGYQNLKDFETKNLKKNLEELMEFTDILIYFNEKLAENGTKNKEWEKYYETLILKFSFHGISLYRILDGYQFKSKYYQNQNIESIEVLDISSAKALLRAQFETFLMLHHIYINPKDDNEKALRYYAWVYSALLRRQEYTVIDNYGEEQKKKDLKREIFYKQ